MNQHFKNSGILVHAFLALFVLGLCFLQPSLFAQSSYTKKVNVIVTDEMNGYPTVIDTILPTQAAAQRFLRLNGYDDAGINRAASASKGQRKISVRTKEILESEYYNVETGKINLDKYFKMPAGATVKETDGIKEVHWVESDNRGNLVTRSATVRVGKRKRLPQNTTTYEMTSPATSIPVNSNTPENMEYLKEMSSVRVNPSINAYPKFTVTVATTDIFDLNTLDNKAAWLPMARGLEVKNFMVSPDYNRGDFFFNFELEEAAADTKLEVFDIVGFPVHSEDLANFSGKYSKTFPDFNLYNRGTYLVLITQESTSRKFTQKVIIR